MIWQSDHLVRQYDYVASLKIIDMHIKLALLRVMQSYPLRPCGCIRLLQVANKEWLFKAPTLHELADVVTLTKLQRQFAPCHRGSSGAPPKGIPHKALNGRPSGRYACHRAKPCRTLCCNESYAHCRAAFWSLLHTHSLLDLHNRPKLAEITRHALLVITLLDRIDMCCSSYLHHACQEHL